MLNNEALREIKSNYEINALNLEIMLENMIENNKLSEYCNRFVTNIDDEWEIYDKGSFKYEEEAYKIIVGVMVTDFWKELFKTHISEAKNIKEETARLNLLYLSNIMHELGHVLQERYRKTNDNTESMLLDLSTDLINSNTKYGTIETSMQHYKEYKANLFALNRILYLLETEFKGLFSNKVIKDYIHLQMHFLYIAYKESNPVKHLISLIKPDMIDNNKLKEYKNTNSEKENFQKGIDIKEETLISLRDAANGEDPSKIIKLVR